MRDPALVTKTYDVLEIHCLERVEDMLDGPVLELKKLPRDGTPRKPGKRRMPRPR